MPDQPSNCRIRPATVADAEIVAAMCKSLARDEGGDSAPQLTPEAFRRDGFGPAAAFSCLIADRDGTAVGYALHCPDYDTDRLCRSVYLADLFVEKAARGLGIGRRLMAAVAGAAAQAGAQQMIWGVLKANAAAQHFYEAVGRESVDIRECWVGGSDFTALAATADLPGALKIRPATAADSGLLAAMLHALLADIDEPAPADAEKRLRKDGFGRTPAFSALIAERDSKPLGYVLFWPTYDTDIAARGGWLSDLYVAPTARRSGLGRRLVAAAAQATAAQGGRFMIWYVLERNAAARAFYRSFSREWTDGTPWICEGAAFDALVAGAAAS